MSMGASSEGSSAQTADVLVLGAGIAGLAAARALAEGGMRPVLLEASASAKGPLLMQSAIEALQACQPYAMLPADRYREWKVLDLGFTPATNLSQLRRIALAEGQAADVPVAWLDVATGSLVALPQRYERRTASTYWYEAPSVGYADLLEVAPSGFVRRYPGLWEAEG